MTATKKAPSRVLSLPARIYLIFYNAIQFLGWSFLLYKMVDFVINQGLGGKSLWEHVEVPLLIFQSGAILEVVHCACGITPSNTVITFAQVYSRVFLIWPILYNVPDARDQIGFSLLLLAWTVTEVLRYLYYVLNLISFVPGILLWCRYTFFIILYPAGVTGELLCCYRALPHYNKTQEFSVLLPNAWNFTFNFYYYTILVMLAYIPVFPQLYTHMFVQRKKILGNKKHD
ncbi:very-long-chain (3R)-3-hydroxyacyl-CoA dehydratase 2 [Daphnia magna]|nr:very-long-chain (3R)-3-hydroxyacyl-CoA dehydratase 2 [Daphnia magna]XP_032795502.1 very-long-chain (3R)-3-hydroxyacyl-CoA dehydratase 2 [Daphnia magna]KAK4013158.1 hypothetical protein OUZ56_025392 [Daphnia magna]